MNGRPRGAVVPAFGAHALLVLALALASGCCPGYVERRWRESGIVRKEGELRASDAHGGRCLQEGEWRYYHRNGELRAQGNYQHDVQDGFWTYYFENGSEEMQGSFVRHRRDGLWKYYYESGRPRAEGRFDQGRRIGEWIFWEEGGERREMPATASEAPAEPVKAQPEISYADAKKAETYERVFGTEKTAFGKRGAASMPSDYPSMKRSAPTGDVIAAARIVNRRLPRYVFQAADGSTVDLKTFAGQRVILVILRGYMGGVCVYCVTQTRALHKQKAFDAIHERDARLLVIFPGPPEGLHAFQELYRDFYESTDPPYKMLYDPGTEVVSALDIEGDLARPTTLILDREGIVRWAYVGEDIQDRPPVWLLLEALDGIE